MQASRCISPEDQRLRSQAYERSPRPIGAPSDCHRLVLKMDVTENELDELYSWVDSIPLSRPKRQIYRDFSDGILAAEIVNYFEPKVIDLHNYVPGSSTSTKQHNWHTLCSKVFQKHLKMRLSQHDIDHVVQCEPGAIERVLKLLRHKLHLYRQAKERRKHEKREQLHQQEYDHSNDATPNPSSGSPAGSQSAPRTEQSIVSAGRHKTATADINSPSSNERSDDRAGSAPKSPQQSHSKRAVTDKRAPDDPDKPREVQQQQQQKHQRPHVNRHEDKPDASPQDISSGKEAHENEQLMKANEILQAKVSKLERLVKLKDQKIESLSAKLQDTGVDVKH